MALVESSGGVVLHMLELLIPASFFLLFLWPLLCRVHRLQLVLPLQCPCPRFFEISYPSVSPEMPVLPRRHHRQSAQNRPGFPSVQKKGTIVKRGLIVIRTLGRSRLAQWRGYRAIAQLTIIASPGLHWSIPVLVGSLIPDWQSAEE